MSFSFRNTDNQGRRYELCPNQTQKETNYANVVDSHVFQPTLRAKYKTVGYCSKTSDFQFLLLKVTKVVT